MRVIPEFGEEIHREGDEAVQASIANDEQITPLSPGTPTYVFLYVTNVGESPADAELGGHSGGPYFEQTVQPGEAWRQDLWIGAGETYYVSVNGHRVDRLIERALG